MEEQAGEFEQALEVDIRRLGEEVALHKEKPELQGAGDREIVRQALQAMTDDDTSDGTSSQSVQTTSTAKGTVIQNPLPDYAANAPAETKLEIEYLLELAFKKGILSANREAKKSSAFVADAFHDALAGKLYPELQKRGMVK